MFRFFAVIFLGIIVGYFGFKGYVEDWKDKFIEKKLIQEWKSIPDEPEKTREEVRAMLNELELFSIEVGLSVKSITGRKDEAGKLEKDIPYVCPECGRITVYSAHQKIQYTISKLDEIRTMLAQVDEVALKLDESRICVHCYMGSESRASELCLLVKYREDKVYHKVCPVYWDDIRLVSDFFSGKKKYWNHGSDKRILKRLEQILLPKLKSL